LVAKVTAAIGMGVARNVAAPSSSRSSCILPPPPPLLPAPPIDA
jgi:hypothetical protein